MNANTTKLSAFTVATLKQINFADDSALLMSASANHPSALSSIDITLWTTIQDYDKAETAYLQSLANMTEAADKVAVQIMAGTDTSYSYADQVSSYAFQASEYNTKMKVARTLIQTLLGIRKGLV